MTYINKIFSLFAIALMAVACDPDAESYTPGGLSLIHISEPTRP